MNSDITFEEYCIAKKISAETFQKADPQFYNELSTLFMQVHPLSFTEQKKFLVNSIRRKYPYLPEETHN